MKRFLVALMMLLLTAVVTLSCGLPPDGGKKLGTVRNALTVQPILISDLPTGNQMAIFFRPELQKNISQWPIPVKRINALTEWTKNYDALFRTGGAGRPYFYMAEFLFGLSEQWIVGTRSVTASLGTCLSGSCWYANDHSYHEGDDWNRYGSDPTLIKSSGSAGKYDFKAPMAVPCNGVVMYKNSSTVSFGNQAYVLCKFAAPWRTRSNGVGALIDGYELVAFKCGHLEKLPNQSVGQKVTIGEDFGLVGETGEALGTHIHSALHRETMLMRCNSNGGENANGDYICPRSFNGAGMVNMWPASAYRADKGYSFIRDNYYDPLELIKSRAGNLLYSARLKTASARNGELESFQLNGISQGQTIVITLNNRDFPRPKLNSRPPLTKIMVLKGAKQVFAGAEDWSDRDQRAVLRGVVSGAAYTIKVLVKNRSDQYSTISDARFQMFITGFHEKSPQLGHYGHSDKYPVIPRRSGLGSNLGEIYLKNREARTADQQNNLRLFNYLKVAYDQALLTCANRYECDANRVLTRCDVVKKIATFLNYEIDQNPIANPFSDLQSSDDCFRFALAAYQQKVITRPSNSTGQFSFQPHAKADRATTVTMLVRALWGEPAKTLPSRFSDVAPNSWYNPYFTRAFDQKLLNGCGGGRACPTGNMTEAHLVIMMMRQMGLDDSLKVSTGDYSSVSQKLVEGGDVGGGYCSGCACTPGQTAPCGSDAGACKTGTVECVDGKWDTSACKGETKPAPEDCDGIDNDCDGSIDNIKGTTDSITKPCSLPDCGTQGVQTCNAGSWSTCSAATCTLGPQCVDNDKDGYGEGPDCIAKDCDDKNKNASPRHLEQCNGFDDDCDGKVDNMTDGSGDLTRGCASVPCGTPGKQQCVQGAWTDCDAPKCPDPCIDKDNDGYFENPSSHCPGPKDCDDTNQEIHPLAQEECDGIDNDCDGQIDNITGKSDPLTAYCFKPPCASKVPIRCLSGKWELCTVQNCPQCLDQDGDGQKVGGSHCGAPDCNDRDSNVKTGAPELCNNQDDDCDGRPDNVSGTDTAITRKCSLNCGADGVQTCFQGKWSDCKGDCLPCKDNDGDGFKVGSPYCSPIDCDDTNPNIYPGAQEECNGKDDDCDGMVDNVGVGEPLKRVCVNIQCGSKGFETCAQGKWSSCSAVCKCEDADKDGFKVGGKHCGLVDCHDHDADISPFGSEVCDGKDNDCNGRVDDGIKCLCPQGFARSCFTGPPATEGKGLCRNGTETCVADGAGGTKWSGCLNEIKATKEVCNGQDDDCDGVIDNGLTCGCKPGETQACGAQNVGECRAGTQTCGANSKWGACIGATAPTAEICDGKDNNCDGQVDEGLTKVCYSGDPQHAGVGICVRGYQKCLNGAWLGICYGEIKPMPEVCDGADNNCDGKVDEDMRTYKPLSRSCYTGPVGTAGIGECRQGTQTCAAGNWGICQNEGRPGTEVCDGKDNDCDGLTDNKSGTNQRLSRPCSRKPCGFAGIEMCRNGTWDATTCSAPQCPQATCTDADGDGYDGSGGSNCTADCDDKDPRVHPGALELCDGKDNDCDGKIDVDAAGKPVTQLCFLSPCNNAGTQTCNVATGKWGSCVAQACPNCQDTDGDGYGVNGAADCTYPGKKDCDDKNRFINPGAKEICDNIDNDCDGYIDNATTGSPAAITGNCTITPCGNPGTRQCVKGVWGTCSGQQCDRCGDLVCNNSTENCTTCPTDCGCASGYQCSNAQCIPACTCSNRQCGPDSCGQGNCGSCPDSRYGCTAQGQCYLICGNGKVDPGENCSTCPTDVPCPSGQTCKNGTCNSCNCNGRQCGPNSCGSGSCGNCPSGTQCDGSGQCKSNAICGDNICQSNENSNNCCKDCGCPNGSTCDGSTCVSNTPTCNCSSWQYCDNGTCKPYFSVQIVGSGCKSVNNMTLCISSSANRCTSSGCQIDVRRSGGTWSGDEMTLRFKNWYFWTPSCWQNFTVKSSEAPKGSSATLTRTVSLTCLTSAGQSLDFHMELVSPATCGANSCLFDTGDLKITRLK